MIFKSLLKHKEWIFSGIGVFVISSAWLCFNNLSNPSEKNTQTSLQPTEENLFGTWIFNQKCSGYQQNGEITYLSNKKTMVEFVYIVEYENSKSNSNWKNLELKVEGEATGDWQLYKDRLAVKIIDLKSEVKSIKIDNEYLDKDEKTYSLLSELYKIENYILEGYSYENIISNISDYKMILNSVSGSDSCPKISELYKK